MSYLYTSAQWGKFFILESFLKDEIHKKILEKSPYIFLILCIMFLVISIILPFRENNKTLLKQSRNVCHYIYEYIKKDRKQNFEKTIRVTMFKAMKEDTDDVFIKSIGRYQITEPNKKPKITFKSGEGVAGLCFYKQSLVWEKDLPEFDIDSNGYYALSNIRYKLSKKKVDKMNTKSCEILCIPIKYSNDQKTWGVLSIDSAIKKTNNEFISNRCVRGIEKIMEHYKVFFTEENKDNDKN
jgi:hypoxanthine phosphoribosyltransferase